MAGSVNSEFQDDNLNNNGVPYVSALVNIAIQTFDDPQLISNAISLGAGSNQSYQDVGVDSSPDRIGKPRYGFNYFFRSLMNDNSGIPGDRRRVVVFDGTTGEILLNEGADGDFSQSQRIIERVNSVESAPMESFALWAAGQSLPAGEMGENDDPDGDEITNLLEYAYGTNPMMADGNLGPWIDVTGGQRRLVYQRSKTAAVNPIEIETATNLASFGSFSPDPGEIEVVDQGETERVSVLLPEGAGRLFVRLRTSAQ